MKQKNKIKEARDIPEARERLKQQILAKAQGVRRYVKKGKFSDKINSSRKLPRGFTEN